MLEKNFASHVVIVWNNLNIATVNSQFILNLQSSDLSKFLKRACL